MNGKVFVKRQWYSQASFNWPRVTIYVSSHTFRIEHTFLAELVQRLSRNPAQAVLELVQNSYDADATKVLITFLPDGLVVEDDAGMNEDQIRSFHTVGGMHADEEFTPSGRRIVGKYRFGRMLVLGVYESMEVRTRIGEFVDATKLAFGDLYSLASGSVTVSVSKPALKRTQGSEFFMRGAKTKIDYTECRKLLSQQPFLRTPGFEVYMKKAETFNEWDFSSAERVLPHDLPGVKLPVKIADERGKIEGVITLVSDVALPLAEEDRGIGIVVSGLLVTRSYFGFENTQHRMDRVTGYVECNSLHTTYGTKDRLIEDENYQWFVGRMKEYFSSTVIPKLQEAEIRLVGRIEIRLLKKVDRVLGKVLADAQFRLPEAQQLPIRLKAFVPAGEGVEVVEESKETSTLIVEVEPTQENQEQAGAPSKEPPAAPIVEPLATEKPVYGNRIEITSTSLPKKTKRVVHYLHDLGIVILFYADRNDERPSYNDPEYTIGGLKVKAVFINKEHPGYKRSVTRNDVLQYIIRLITNEITAMGYSEGSEVIRTANKLYGLAASYI
jgi:hypothetical protein